MHESMQHQIFLLEYFGRFFRGEIDEELLRLWPAAQQALEDMDGEPVEFRDLNELELKKAFAKTFYGVGEFVVPLTKSAWESRDQLAFGPSSGKASRMYSDAGVRVECGQVLPADHIGISLSFAAELLRRARADEASAFLAEFASSWTSRAVDAALTQCSSEDLGMMLELFRKFSARF